MPWNFTDDQPIFQQIVQIISNQIVSGVYQPGDKLPTVRELSLQAGVNPNTMQRAFSAIEDTGLIYSKRGDGRYVSENLQIHQKHANESLDKAVDDFLETMKSMGFDKEQVITCIEQKWKEKF